MNWTTEYDVITESQRESDSSWDYKEIENQMLSDIQKFLKENGADMSKINTKFDLFENGRLFGKLILSFDEYLEKNSRKSASIIKFWTSQPGGAMLKFLDYYLTYPNESKYREAIKEPYITFESWFEILKNLDISGDIDSLGDVTGKLNVGEYTILEMMKRVYIREGFKQLVTTGVSYSPKFLVNLCAWRIAQIKQSYGYWEWIDSFVEALYRIYDFQREKNQEYFKKAINGIFSYNYDDVIQVMWERYFDDYQEPEYGLNGPSSELSKNIKNTFFPLLRQFCGLPNVLGLKKYTDFENSLFICQICRTA